MNNKETREERIIRRKQEGYNNPKKDKWARRKMKSKSKDKKWEDMQEDIKKRIAFKKKYGQG